MKSESEIRDAIDRLEDEAGEYDTALGNRITALKWVLGRRFEDITE